MCGQTYDLEGEVAGVPGRLAPGEEVSATDGIAIEINLCGRPMQGIVAGEDSPMREKGFDVLFLVCSRECVAAIKLAAALDADADGHDVDDDAEGVYWLRRRRPGDALTDRTMERLELFESILRTVAPHIAKRLGCDTPVPAFDPNARPEDIDDLVALLAKCCVWCLRSIPPGQPRKHLRVSMNDDDMEGKRVAIIRIGDRTVPARLTRPGSREGASADAVFTLCSRACRNELAEVIVREQRMRLVH
jgi:hypothetical protein